MMHDRSAPRRHSLIPPRRGHRERLLVPAAILVIAVLSGCAAPEARSLLGRPLYAEPSGDVAALSANLNAAERAHAQSPADLGATIWHGRRLGYLFRMNEAISVFSAGLDRWPDEPHLLRHRGHRYISVRKFAAAISDLERAAELMEGKPDEIETDGQPNAANIPLTTLKFNIWYHLALARFLQRDYSGADKAWLRTMEFLGGHDDNLCAVTDWRYLTLRKLRRDAEADTLLQPIHFDMRILENFAYHQRLLLYKGVVRPEEVTGRPSPRDPAGHPAAANASAGEASTVTAGAATNLATVGYGIGCWHAFAGRVEQARLIWRRTSETSAWPAFGVIAAEVELSRSRDNAAR